MTPERLAEIRIIAARTGGMVPVYLVWELLAHTAELDAQIAARQDQRPHYGEHGHEQ